VPNIRGILAIQHRGSFTLNYLERAAYHAQIAHSASSMELLAD